MVNVFRLFFLTFFFGLLLTEAAHPQPPRPVPPPTATGTNGERSSVLIRNADVVRSLDYKGNIINRLLGNIIIEHLENGAIITCDSAYMYTADSLDLFSKVEMFNGPSTIRCDKMTYDGTWAKVRGHIVRMSKENMVLLTQQFDYNINEELGIYFGGGTVDRNGEILESDRGYFYSKSDLFAFASNVAVRNKDYVIACDTMQYNMKTEDITFLGPTRIWRDDKFISAEYGWQHKAQDELHFSKKVYMLSPDKELWADSLFYLNKEQKGRLYGNIQAIDTVHSALLFGDEGHFANKPEMAEITKKPAILYYAERKESSKKTEQPAPVQTAKPTQTVDTVGVQKEPFKPKHDIDTLYVVADTIRSVGIPNPAFVKGKIDTLSGKPVDSLYREMFAYRNVRMYRKDMQAVCDSMMFNTRDSIARMYVKPVLWSDTTQLSSDTMRFTMVRQALESADFLGSAFIAMKEDSIRFSQIKGRNMKAFFRQNELYKLDVYGNSQSLYYLRETQDSVSVITNANLSESADISISIADNRLQRVKYIYDPQSKIYPIEKLPEEDQKLKGMNWQEARRPKTKEELFTRTIRPSQRKDTEKFQQPLFNTTNRLVGIEAKSWVHPVEFKPIIKR